MKENAIITSIELNYIILKITGTKKLDYISSGIEHFANVVVVRTK